MPRTLPGRSTSCLRTLFFLPGEQGTTTAFPATAAASAIIQKLVNNCIQNCLYHSRLPTTIERQVKFFFPPTQFIMTPIIPILDGRPASSLHHVRPLSIPNLRYISQQHDCTTYRDKYANRGLYLRGRSNITPRRRF